MIPLLNKEIPLATMEIVLLLQIRETLPKEMVEILLITTMEEENSFSLIFLFLIQTQEIMVILLVRVVFDNRTSYVRG